jgi:hypothetical protein
MQEGRQQRRDPWNSRVVSNFRELATAGTPAIGTPYLAKTSSNSRNAGCNRDNCNNMDASNSRR